MPFCPESPKFLLLDKDDEERATSALNWLRGSVDVHSEMDEMRAEQEKMKLIPHISFKEMFTNGALRSPLFIALMMMLAQQLSGINAVSSCLKLQNYFIEVSQTSIFHLNNHVKYFRPFSFQLRFSKTRDYQLRMHSQQHLVWVA